MERAKRLKVLHNGTGSRIWRLIPQLHYINSVHGWEVDMSPGNTRQDLNKILQSVEWCDVLLYQSVFDDKVYEHARKLGKRIIFEFDDLLHEVPEDHPEHSKVVAPGFKEGIFKMMGQVDACITTNEYLKSQYSDVNPNIHVFPNYMDFEFWEKPVRPAHLTNQVRIGWAGSLSHVCDLKWIMPVIKRVLDKYPHVKFVHCGAGGVVGDELMQFNYGKDLLSELPPERREYSLGAPVESWPDKLNSLHFDIAIAPLVDNRFNRCRTPIKWMEYGINHVPSVCSRFMYQQVVEDGKDGFLADTHDEWFERLCQLIENASLRREMGEAAYRSVKEKYGIDPHLDEWVSIING